VSKARLVITAVVVENRSPGEVARTYGVARSWVYELVARYHAEGEAAFEPRSRRPNRSPTATPDHVAELVLEHRKTRIAEGLDAGPETLAWWLEHHHQIRVSPSTGNGWERHGGPCDDHRR
jgi:transposase